MSWISRRELVRLERERGDALRRAKEAENHLAAERQRHDWMVLQLTSRVVTKHGGYGLEYEKQPYPDPSAAPAAAKGYTHEPTAEDIDVLNFYKACAAEAGQPEQTAVDRWEARMRGEDLYVDNTEM